MADNYSEWMKNTLNLEIDDWKKEGDPELDNEGCFHTSAPKIIYQVSFIVGVSIFFIFAKILLKLSHNVSIISEKCLN